MRLSTESAISRTRWQALIGTQDGLQSNDYLQFNMAAYWPRRDTVYSGVARVSGTRGENIVTALPQRPTNKTGLFVVLIFSFILPSKEV